MESYYGINVRLRYFVRVVCTRSYGSLTSEEEFVVQNVWPEPEINKFVWSLRS